MKTAISIPDELFKQAEVERHRRKIPRSTLIAEALREYLDKRRSKAITDKLNEIYSDHSSALDPDVARMISHAPLDEWK